MIRRRKVSAALAGPVVAAAQTRRALPRSLAAASSLLQAPRKIRCLARSPIRRRQRQVY